MQSKLVNYYILKSIKLKFPVTMQTQGDIFIYLDVAVQKVVKKQ